MLYISYTRLNFLKERNDDLMGNEKDFLLFRNTAHLGGCLAPRVAAEKSRAGAIARAGGQQGPL